MASETQILSREMILSAYKAALHLSRILYKSAPFMQNKANFLRSQMNVNPYNTEDYENISDWTLGENKPNSNPIKPNLQDTQMSVNSILTNDYEINDIFAVPENKPNSNPNKANFRLSLCL